MSGWALLGLSLLASAGSAGLEKEAAAAVRQAFERVGRRAPQPDAALEEAARQLARQALSSSARDAAEPSGVAAAVSRARGADPHPRTFIVRADPRETAMDTFRNHPGLAAEAASHMGVAYLAQGDWAVVVALLTQRRAELQPFPRHFPDAGLSRVLCGRLASGFGRAEVFITRPAGTVERLPLTHERSEQFCSHLTFPQAGLHAVEVLARGPQGPEVVSLFEVEVGPKRPRAAAVREAEPQSVEESRAHILERINTLRRAHGLLPLRADEALDAVAQAYSERMADEGFFAHVSPEGASLRGRLTQAGYRYRSAGENLGFATGPLAAHRGIEQSPGHRSSLLTSSYSHVGIGVAFRERGGQRDVVLTEVLVEPLQPSGPHALADVYRQLAERRTLAGLPPQVRSEVLEQLARDHARRALALDEPSDELPGSVLHERVFAALPALTGIAVDFVISEEPTALPELLNLRKGHYDRVGVGMALGDSARYGKGRAWLVVVYASSQ
jgi:uncharacterized protein YkwD